MITLETLLWAIAVLTTVVIILSLSVGSLRRQLQITEARLDRLQGIKKL